MNYFLTRMRSSRRKKGILCLQLNLLLYGCLKRGVSFQGVLYTDPVHGSEVGIPQLYLIKF